MLARPDSALVPGVEVCRPQQGRRSRAAAAVLVAILAGTGLATWQAHVALTEKARALEVRDFLITLFRDASPYNAGGRALSALDWLKQVKARVDRRLDDRPALRVELLNIVGSSLLTLQDTAAADEVLTQAVQEGTRDSAPITRDAAGARADDARPSLSRPDRRRCVPSSSGCCRCCARANGALAEDLVIALKNQAHLEIDEGHYDAAERRRAGGGRRRPSRRWATST